MNILLKEYVRFSVQLYRYERAVKKAELANVEEIKDNHHVATPVINSNADTTASICLQNASYSSAEGSSNSLEQECEETLQEAGADNAKIILRGRSNGGVAMWSIGKKSTQTRISRMENWTQWMIFCRLMWNVFISILSRKIKVESSLVFPTYRNLL